MKATKMHGCGNDYIYMDVTAYPAGKGLDFCPSELSIRISDRHKGIGSDGLILICGPLSPEADFYMRIFNADGSEGDMCGNGIRCVGKYVYDKGLTDKKELVVETKAGLKYLTLIPGEDGKIAQVTVNMGHPLWAPDQVPVLPDEGMDPTAPVVDDPIAVLDKVFRITAVSTGNPHGVVFVDSTADFPMEKYGPHFENHPRFPRRVNTEFVQVLSDNEINMRVWERGSNETMACGTGSCAAVMACIKNGKTGNDVTVHLLGGDLRIRYDEETDLVYMTGPAETVCECEFE